MKRIMSRRFVVSILAVAALGGSALPAAVPAQKRTIPAEARRVEEALERIEKARPAVALRRLEFTDNDLNVYIRYRLQDSKEDVLRDLRVKVEAGNRIEGWMDLDFGRYRIPAFIKKRMNLYFLGVMIIQNSHVRFEFEEVFLEKERVPVMLLDAIVFVASQLGKTDAKGVTDWHPLPSGIKDVRTSAGRFALYY